MKTKTLLILIPLLLLGFISCNSSNKELTKDDRVIIPYERVGLVTSTTTKAELKKIYPKADLKDTVVFSSEGINVRGTQVSFVDSLNDFSIEWKDDKLTPKIIRIKKPNSNWKTKDGIGINSTIKDVEKANGKPFTNYGFEIDAYLAGTVKSWNAGKLKGLDIQFVPTKDLPGEEYMKIIGDNGFLSNNPLFEKAGLKVAGIAVYFNKKK